MNLYLRVFYVLLRALFAARIANVMSPAIVPLRVLPNDLDTNLHMNNGRYLTIMDLGRLDLILRSGLLRLMLKRRYQPVLAAVQMRFRMPLKPFCPYDLQTRIICWDDKWIYMEQRFLFKKTEKSGAVAAIGIVKGGFYDPVTKTTVPTSALLHALNLPNHSPDFPAHIAEWVEAEEALRNVTSI